MTTTPLAPGNPSALDGFGLRFEGIERVAEPYPHFTVRSTLDNALADELSRWLERTDRWMLKNDPSGAFYNFFLSASMIPRSLSEFFSPGNLKVFKGVIEDLFEVRMSPEIFISANRFAEGQSLKVHSDFADPSVRDERYNPTHRFLIYLNRGWQEEQGGHLGLYRAPGDHVPTVRIAPSMNRGVGLDLGPGSYHAVLSAPRGSRYSLCFSLQEKESVSVSVRAAKETLAGRISFLGEHEVPGVVLEDARALVIDTLAVACSASEDRVVQVLGKEAARWSAGDARLWWSDRRASVPEAGFVNACMAHSMDFDAVHYAACGHPGVVTVPAALALGKSIRAPGRAILSSIAVGLEAMNCLGIAFGEALRENGYHPTSVLGAPAAAVTAGWLLDLSPRALENALSLATSTAAGLSSSFGTMNKPYQVGSAVRAGIHAAIHAYQGLPLAPPNHWMQSLSQLAALEESKVSLSGFGERWVSDQLPPVFKTYPACNYFSYHLSRLCELMRPSPRARDEIVSMEVSAPSYVVAASRFDYPETADQARFCLPYLLSIAAGGREPRLRDFGAASFARSDLRALCGRIRVVEATAPSDGGSIRVRFADGSEYSQEVPRIVHPKRDPDLVRDKFIACVSSRYGTSRALSLLDSVRSLEKQDSLDLDALLASAEPEAS